MSKQTERNAKERAVHHRPLTPKELEEIREMSRIAAAERYKFMIMQKNPGNVMFQILGKGLFGRLRLRSFLKEQEVMAQLAENTHNLHVHDKLKELGYPQGAKVALNMETGQIIVQ